MQFVYWFCVSNTIFYHLINLKPRDQLRHVVHTVGHRDLAAGGQRASKKRRNSYTTERGLGTARRLQPTGSARSGRVHVVVELRQLGLTAFRGRTAAVGGGRRVVGPKPKEPEV